MLGEKCICQKNSLGYFLILVTIWAYQRKWYQNIDFEFFPSLFIIFSKFVIWMSIFMTELKIHWKYFVILLKKKNYWIKTSFFQIMSRGQPYPRILKNIGEETKLSLLLIHIWLFTPFMIKKWFSTVYFCNFWKFAFKI